MVRRDLPTWRVVNAAAVASLTLGNDLASIDGTPVRTRDGVNLPAIVRCAVPILVADGLVLDEVHVAALAATGVTAIGLSDAMLATNSYDAYAAEIATRPVANLGCFALALAGPPDSVRRLTGSLALYLGTR